MHHALKQSADLPPIYERDGHESPYCEPKSSRYPTPNLDASPALAPIMAFRDHLAGAHEHNEQVSCVHDFFDLSCNQNHSLIVFNDVLEAVGHRAAMNVLSRDRLCARLGMSPGQVVDLLGRGMSTRSEPQLISANEAPVLQSGQEEPDLHGLPIPWHYREDRGRYMSASIVIAEWDGRRNVSFHRQFLRDANHVVARLVPRHLRTMVDEARANGETVNIAIVNGCDPVVLLAAAMSFDEPIDEMTVAASLHEAVYGTPLQVVTLPNGIAVPADAEYAMTATITLEDDDEGPYVDITGTLDEVRQEPVFEIHTVHHRTDPIFHALIPAESEHKALMGLPRAPTVKSAVAAVCECHDVHMTDGGCGWLAAVVSITPQNEGDGRRAIEAALAGHRSMKMVTIVDSDIDVGDAERVEWAMMTRWQPDVDTVILTGQKGSSLDPTRAADGTTSKVGFDATMPPGCNRAPFTSVR